MIAEVGNAIRDDLWALVAQCRGIAHEEWGALIYKHVWLAQQHYLLLAGEQGEEHLVRLIKHLMDALSLAVEGRQ